MIKWKKKADEPIVKFTQISNFIYVQDARHLGFEQSLTHLNSTYLSMKLIRCVYRHEKNKILFISLLFYLFIFCNHHEEILSI